MRTDAAATVPSLVVAALSMLLLGLGGWLWWVVSGLGDSGAVLVKSVLLGTVFSFALWLVWLLVVYALLQRLSHVAIPVDQLLRTAGMATAPLAGGALMFIPAVSFAIGLVAIAVWVIAMQEAVERATEVRRGPALLANAAGFAVWALVMSLLSTASDHLAPGPFLAESVWEAVASIDSARVLVGG